MAQCRRYVGAKVVVPLLTTAYAPPFWFTQNTVFGTSRYKTSDNDGKRNNYV